LVQKALLANFTEAFTFTGKNLTDFIRQRWEKQANVVISGEVWLQLWKNKSSTTNSFLWQHFCFLYFPKSEI